MEQLQAFIAICQKHLADVQREHGNRFPTRAEYDAMTEEARIRAIREIKAAA